MDPAIEIRKVRTIDSLERLTDLADHEFAMPGRYRYLVRLEKDDGPLRDPVDHIVRIGGVVYAVLVNGGRFGHYVIAGEAPHRHIPRGRLIRLELIGEGN